MNKYVMISLFAPLFAFAGGDPIRTKDFPQSKQSQNTDSGTARAQRESYEKKRFLPEPDLGLDDRNRIESIEELRNNIKEPTPNRVPKIIEVLLKCCCVTGGKD